MLLLDDDDELPHQPSVLEASLVSSLAAEKLADIDDALIQASAVAWRKVARVVHDAMTSGRYDPWDEAALHLHVRRIDHLVSDGILEAQGNLRRPRWSEVRLHQRSAV